MYQEAERSGGSSEYWGEYWDTQPFADAVRFCAIDPLRSLFEKYLGADSLILEGGCGMGQYVAYYAARGHRIVGLDFSYGTLRALHRHQPRLDVLCGDVAQFPFSRESFDVYYSGGVVEHFEGGATAALQEAHRVLKRQGVLLISVPYYSPLRRMIAPFKRRVWFDRTAPQIEAVPSRGLAFFQYAYRPAEFEEMLGQAGFDVVETQGYAILWGLADLRWRAPRKQSNRRNSASPVAQEEVVDVRTPSLLKRLLISEDDTVPLAGSFVRLMRWAAANMMMYVCVRR